MASSTRLWKELLLEISIIDLFKWDIRNKKATPSKYGVFLIFTWHWLRRKRILKHKFYHTTHHYCNHEQKWIQISDWINHHKSITIKKNSYLILHTHHLYQQRKVLIASIFRCFSKLSPVLHLLDAAQRSMKKYFAPYHVSRQILWFAALKSF